MEVAFAVNKEHEKITAHMLNYVKSNIPNFLKATNSPVLPECMRRKIALSENLMKHGEHEAALKELKGTYLLIRGMVG